MNFITIKGFPHDFMMNGTCVQAVSFGVGEAEGAGVEVADCPAMSFVFVC